MGSALQGGGMEGFAEAKAKVQTALKSQGARGYFQQILDLTKEEEKKENL
jgi:hypothetical protein